MCTSTVVSSLLINHGGALPADQPRWCPFLFSINGGVPSCSASTVVSSLLTVPRGVLPADSAPWCPPCSNGGVLLHDCMVGWYRAGYPTWVLYWAGQVSHLGTVLGYTSHPGYTLLSSHFWSYHLRTPAASPQSVTSSWALLVVTFSLPRVKGGPLRRVVSFDRGERRRPE